MVKILNTKESVLDKESLKNYLAKLAADNLLKDGSNLDTYPIERVKENFEYISLVYTLLVEHAKIDIPIHPAGEWILDNYYIIENSVKTIQKNLTPKLYSKLPGVLNNGFARVYVLANEIIANSDAKIDMNDLIEYLMAYQTQKYLEIEEIWEINIFLQIAIIEKIRHICEKIFVSQMQKCKVDDIVKRLVEGKIDSKFEKLFKSKTLNGEYEFVEYMSYKLKRYGKDAVPYLEALEEETNKIGMTVSTIIEREHFDVAVKRLSMKNCITSLKVIQRMDMLSIFENTSMVENIMREDPRNIYEDMDYETKTYYRNSIIRISKKSHTSEIYVAEKALELAQKHNVDNELEKHSHIGYYLIDDGLNELLSTLEKKKIRTIEKKEKALLYVFSIYLFSVVTTILFSTFIGWYSIMFFVPIQNIITKIIQYILGKNVKTKIIPKMNCNGNIPDDAITMCAIPVVLKDENTVREIFEKLEVYYLANKSSNLFFTLLGDCKSSDNEKTALDEKIIKEGILQTQILNKKYGSIFNFVYRKREWSDSEQCFMGWERKRGLINQFNDFLKTGKSKFIVNTCANLPKIKYVIVLDSDTNLTLNSVFKLVGAMQHILNKPEIDQNRNIVKAGHGIIQPRIGLDIENGRKNAFTRLFAGNGGTDFYANAISDVYQDNFDEGIYTGKGIYDLDTFYEVLNDTIPENKILSHDLLEGSYLRCGLASDIMLLDGYPSNYLSYKVRQDRWIRGDIQVLTWITSKLNLLSKYKILDNIVRNSSEIFLLLEFLIGFFTKKYTLSALSVLLLAIPMAIDLVDKLLYEKIEIESSNLFTNNPSKVASTIYMFFMQFMILPDKAITEIVAISKSIYRMFFTHSFMLEWVTADEAEKNLKNNLLQYYDSMIVEIIIGIVVLLSDNCIFNGIGLMWIFAPVILYVCGKCEINIKDIPIKDKEYLLGVGRLTWQYFKDNMINYLPSDNYQEDRKEKIVKRTSPTNIGLELMATISSYDLKYENLANTVELIKNIIDTIEKLPKWNGHLYNWYDIEKLEPIHPLDISSVDSGNFIGYMITTNSFLNDILKEKIFSNNELLKNCIDRINLIIQDTDFKKLYDEKVGLFSIGYNVEENKLYDSYYDLLASESRQTSLIAIAKKDVKEKHWHNLSRTLTQIYGHRGLVSWGGTAFEYLMPSINIPSYDSTILDESCKLLILSQIKYSQKLGIPWGISEAAYSKKDLYGNYQYKTFGIPWLGLKRGLGNEAVVSPYSTAMALSTVPEYAIDNLKRIEREGGKGKYGFYDSIDYIPKKIVVRTYMAHHQGMIITSIDNCINNQIFQKRFMENPEIRGIKVLLEENMPDNPLITKEKKDRAQKIKYNIYEENIERMSGINALCNRKYLNVISDKGETYSKLESICLFDNEVIYIKDINSKKIQTTKDADIKNSFFSYMTRQKLEDGNIKININTTIAPDSQIEIKEIKIENMGITELNLEVTDCKNIILSNLEQYKAHPSFDKMFLNFKYDDGKILISRKARMENEKVIFLNTTMYEDGDAINNGKFEYEINKEKIYARGEKGIPKIIKESLPFSSKIENVVNPILAMKKVVFLKPNEIKKIYIITSAEDNEAKSRTDIQEYMNNENLERVFELSKVQTEAENRYLQVTGKDVALFQKMLGLIFKGENRSQDIKFDTDISNKRLWKYGISGDYPILLISIKEYNDYYVIDEILKAFEYYLSKDIHLNIVIVTYSNIYADIFENIIKKGMEKYLNAREGIFILNDLKREERMLLEMRSNIIIDADNGGTLGLQLSRLENKYINEEKCKIINKIKDKQSESDNIRNEKNNIQDVANRMSLKLFNGFGGYNNDYSEYCIIQNINHRLPVAWSNIMANDNFGTVITDSFGGFTWYKNSRTNRITRFSNDAYMDDSSELIYFENNDNKWTSSLNVLPEEGNYIVSYGFGYSNYNHLSHDIAQNITVFVPEKINSKVTIIKLKNNSIESKKIKIKYDFKFMLGERDDSCISQKYNSSLNMNLIRNNKNPSYCVYVSSNESINENYEVEVELRGLEDKNVIFVLGAEEDENNCIESAAECTNNYEMQLKNTKAYWSNLVSTIKSNTQDSEFDALQNGWLVYQTICSRLIAKTGFYQTSGGYGFRDQLQDAIGMKYVSKEILKNQILLHANHQFTQGDVEHWWHEDSELGIRTRYTDDLLWLPYAVIEYIKYSGDYSILNENAEYLEASPLDNWEADRVDMYTSKQHEGITRKFSILDHCIRAIDYSLSFGKNNLPLMGGGDWNDGMNCIGKLGKGESVWLGFFLYDVLNRFSNIIADKLPNKAIKYQETAEKLKKSLNTTAWDGRWYKRAFDDNNNEVGSIKNDECKIDSIAQSWAVISNAGDNDKKYIALESAEKYLIDNENKLVKLLTPPLEQSQLGYITSYTKGTRENGGQYTHAAIWMLIAETIMNSNNKAYEIYKKINPIEHTKNEQEILKYKVEPYVIEADIYSEGNLAGRGGWTWYTGSSSWLYTAQVQYILGINIENNKMIVKPCVPDDWDKFNVEFKWYNALYIINYKRGLSNEIKTEIEVDLQKEGKYVIEVIY